MGKTGRKGRKLFEGEETKIEREQTGCEWEETAREREEIKLNGNKIQNTMKKHARAIPLLRACHFS
jgi:hypothetical protein